MTKATKILLPVVILALGFGAMYLLLGMRSDPPPRSDKPRSRIVLSQVVDLDRITTEVTAYGRVVSANPIELYSEVAGTVEPGQVAFQPAQEFSKGALLLKIDDRQARMRLNSAKSELLTALAAALAEVKSNYPEAYPAWQEFFDKCDFDRNTEPLPQTSDERLKLLMSRFNVYKIYYAVRDQEIVVEKHRIYAPFAGSIVQANVRAGSTVRVGTLLGSIISLESQEVRVSLPASDLSWVNRGGKVVLTSSETAERWQGRLARIGSSVDPRTQTVDVFVTIDQNAAQPLVSGAFLQAHIPGREVDAAVSLPRRALYDDRIVYRVTDGRLDGCEVDVARWGDDFVIVAGGLKDGDTVAVEALQGVAPGMPASPRFDSADGSH